MAELPPARGLNLDDAAKYCGVTKSSFQRLVRRGLLPKPIKLCGLSRWDRVAIDRVWNRHSGIADDAPSPRGGCGDALEAALRGS